ncbi:MAG TPA: SRPBCC family protein [Caulobacteraceae bacterium]|jgi:uncharacterized membrane protein|nr:SRPBCC family protein [Caulobacteraceae bacterium]
MSQDKIERAAESDAPLHTAVHQRDISHDLAETAEWNHAALVGRTVTINRSRAEVYAFFRDFRNFPAFMENVERVDVGDNRRSHWVVKAPAGQTVEWDSEITEDQPGSLIIWRSVEGADIRNTGRVEFRDAAPGRGTEVEAIILYEPPAGDLGKLFAKVFQKEPKIQVRRDLRRFKQLMETGEVSTARAPDAAPRG